MSTINLIEKLDGLRTADPIAEARLILLKQTADDVEFLRQWGFDHAVKQMEIAKSIFGIDKTHIYTLEHIRKLCVKYSLRLRPVSLFRGNIGHTVIGDLREFQKKYGKKAKLFIAAPHDQFDPDPRPVDPLLFASVGPDLYCLISQWGGDISWTRRFWRRIFPLSLITMLNLAVIAVGIIFSLWWLLFLLPTGMWLLMFSVEPDSQMIKEE